MGTVIYDFFVPIVKSNKRKKSYPSYSGGKNGDEDNVPSSGSSSDDIQFLKIEKGGKTIQKHEIVLSIKKEPVEQDEEKLAQEHVQKELEEKLAQECAQKELEEKLAQECAQKELERKLAQEHAQKELEEKLR